MQLRRTRSRRPARRSPLTPVGSVGRGRLGRRLNGLPRPLRVAIDWIGTLVVAVGIVLLLRACVVTPYRVPSAVMEPALHCAVAETPAAVRCLGTTADRVLVNRLAYRLGNPERGDIAAVEVSARAARQCGLDEGDIVLLRVVGLPGEQVQLTRGRLSVDGERLAEPYVGRRRRGRESGTWRVPRERWFLLGDNRAEACDSRRWGPVSDSALVGSVFARYWPTDRIGLAATLPR